MEMHADISDLMLDQDINVRGNEDRCIRSVPLLMVILLRYSVLQTRIPPPPVWSIPCFPKDLLAVLRIYRDEV